MCDQCGCQANTARGRKVLDINKSLLEENQKLGEENRRHIQEMGAVGINIISSPGAGKTTLLEATADAAAGHFSFGVIEGDIETERDAERIRKKGIPAVQITTGGACHLDAHLVHGGIHQIQDTAGPEGLDIIFIENVGNLVCPATFYLGEHQRIVMVSVPEGSDKPAKYPRAFIGSDLFIISKADLLPYFDFSMEEASEEAKRLNPDIKILTVSAVTGEGMEHWLSYLSGLLNR